MTKLKVVVGNIAEQRGDAIVKAANSHLASGSGVCGAIFKGAGPGLAEEIAEKHPDGCSTGSVATTSAFNLPAKYIIHAVAPEYWGYEDVHFLMRSVYVEMFHEARALGLKSIAIPSLGTGVYGWDMEEATREAYAGVLDGLETYPGIEEVTFCCFDQSAVEVYNKIFDGKLNREIDFTKRCPDCNGKALPVFYGLMAIPPTEENDYLIGGCMLGPDAAQWGCRECGIEFLEHSQLHEGMPSAD
jgi:O-acetyl-ADP-ribose deacetylase (regulator of RNase III)